MSAPPLESTGYVLIDDFLEPDQCEALLSQINSYRGQAGVSEIYRPMRGRSLRYSVIDGEEIKQNLPAIWELYQGPMNDLVNELSNTTVAPLSNVKAGVNVNVMAPGNSEYRWHYDRSAVTAILYLNEVEGGATELYPNYRILLDKWRFSRLQRLVDGCLRPKLIRDIFGKKAVVRPSPGRVIAMQGTRCWHSVGGVRGRHERVNVILAYDAPDARFPMEEGLDSYLYTRNESGSRDPNYAR